MCVIFGVESFFLVFGFFWSWRRGGIFLLSWEVGCVFVFSVLGGGGGCGGSFFVSGRGGWVFFGFGWVGVLFCWSWICPAGMAGFWSCRVEEGVFFWSCEGIVVFCGGGCSFDLGGCVFFVSWGGGGFFLSWRGGCFFEGPGGWGGVLFFGLGGGGVLF